MWDQDGYIDIGQVLFLHVYGQDGVKFHKLAKKGRRPISSLLDQTSLVNKGFILWLLVTVGRSGQDSSILPAQIANHSAGFGSSCLLKEL